MINKKIILLSMLLLPLSLCFGATLHSLNNHQMTRAFVNKTLVSIPTDNLNGKTIHNTFTMRLDAKGHIFGTMSQKPTHEPKKDTGIYVIKGGALYITWQHWDGHKKLCAHFFETKNAYIAIDCHHVFHTVFLKESIR